MSIIKNSKDIAITPERRDLLSVAEAALSAIDTETVLRKRLLVTDGVLKIDGHEFVLANYRNIYIVGVGKVSCKAAQVLEDILDGHVRAGAVVGLAPAMCQVVDTYTGTHPMPSHQNYTATRHIEEIAHQATEDDLVVAIISGGGSALLCGTMSECEQGQKLYTAFLQSGGTIEELNTVRKHISRVKGGGLAAALYPATVVGLIFSDVPGGDAAAVASGPTYFDKTTVTDAQQVITKYRLGNFTLNETPKQPEFFAKVHNFVVVSNQVALDAAAAAAMELGYRPQILGNNCYYTHEEVRALVAAHTSPGTCVLFGGETKLTIPDGCKGRGGRNDALALAMASILSPGQTFLSLASDGRDNTEAAGALSDGHTMAQAQALRLKLEDYTTCQNSYPFFEATGGHMVTGLLDSNVSDLVLWLNAKTTPKGHAITSVTGRAIKDSRGKATILVTVVVGEHVGNFSVPSGASTGSREVVALPAEEALKQLMEVVAPALVGHEVSDQAGIDALLHKLDGTKSFSRIGGNTALGVSVAALRAAAASRNQEPWQYIETLFREQPQAEAPRLFINMINGGAHAPYGSFIQEHQIIPETTDVALALGVAEAVWEKLTIAIEEAYTTGNRSVGDEGGHAIRVTDPLVSFSYLRDAIAQSDVDVPISLGTDIAASAVYEVASGKYHCGTEHRTAAEQLVWYESLHNTFEELRYVEDPFDESDMVSFARYQKAHQDIVTIGDDLTTTNESSVRKAVRARAISGLIIKPNQIGTITDTLATMRRAYQAKVKCIVSHRSGETMDDFIADLAYGTKCYGLKAGAPTMPERRVKYERLLTIVKKGE